LPCDKGISDDVGFESRDSSRPDFGINVEKNMRAQALPKPTSPHSRPAPGPSSRIQRQLGTGFDLVVVESTPASELHLTLMPQANETPAALVGRLTQVLGVWDATMVQLTAFGSLDAHQPVREALKQTSSLPVFPLTWVEGRSCTNHPIAGMQVHGVIGAKVQTEEIQSGAVTCVWDDATATHCVLNGILPPCPTANALPQAAQTLENLQASLARTGMTMKDVARTWFYLDDILSWYGDFNRARNDFFARCELRPGSIPASTGVSGRNSAGSALTAAAWAVRAHEAGARSIQVVPSPRQCPAPAYGSAFSRAVEIHSSGFRQLLVSGTASIAPDGRTEHVGDGQRQIELSMQVVQDILESRSMSFADVSRATAYFKFPADVAAWEDWRDQHKHQTLPAVCTCCDICRDDLLFEIELDAIRAGG
jgi:enamine deaminase RidA (YjgF/YER057c/UK114 family)